MMFQKPVAPGIKEVVAVCSNPPCNAMFDLMSGDRMKLRQCEKKGMLEKYPEPMLESEWARIYAEAGGK